MWWKEVLLDALIDTAYLLPFFLLLYILIELMEHNTRIGKPNRAIAGRFAPAVGAACGLVPMCGFSVMAAKLYVRRHITIGTLIAVFIATSDEALLVLLLGNMGWKETLFTLLALVGSKFLLGAAVGLLLDALLRSRRRLAPLPVARDHHEHHEEHGAHGDLHEEHEEHGEHHDHEHGDCECGELTVCEHGKESVLSLYLLSPVLHTLRVAAFVFLANLLFGTLVFLVGTDRVTAFLQGAGYWYQPLFCALVGGIPNCASSVILAETYVLGGIGFGGLLSGLIVNAGLGYLVLFGKNSYKAGLGVLGGLLLFGMAAGYAASAVALLI